MHAPRQTGKENRSCWDWELKDLSACKIKNAANFAAFFIYIAILLLAQRSNAYIRFAFAFFAEGNRAVNQCEERVILADTYVLARIVDSTSLANDDVASFSELTTEKFDTESLAFRLAAVL